MRDAIYKYLHKKNCELHILQKISRFFPCFPREIKNLGKVLLYKVVLTWMYGLLIAIFTIHFSGKGTASLSFLMEWFKMILMASMNSWSSFAIFSKISNLLLTLWVCVIDTAFGMASIINLSTLTKLFVKISCNVLPRMLFKSNLFGSPLSSSTWKLCLQKKCI